ncbi:hypothetical protein GW17_00032562 [Ensete ventricosum]|nr:hypothetical protein GW17_00032562 [Ensete ventricosum]
MDRVHDVRRVINCMGDKITDLRNEIRELKDDPGLTAVAIAKQRVVDPKLEIDQLKSNLRDLKEVRGKFHIMEDELLKISQDLEATRSKAREVEEALHSELQKAPEKAQEVIVDY